MALELTKRCGFDDELVTVLAGGWDAWREKGYPTASGETLEPTPTTPGEDVVEFEVIQAAAYAYLSSSPAWNITAAELLNLKIDGNPDNDPFILSVRSPSAYALGHIPGAINITLSDLTKPENLAKLPNDKKIVVYCYTGHTGSQATAILNVLGYDAVNLKFGMTSWTLDTEVATGRYIEANDCKDYPYETTANLPADTYTLPEIENTASGDQDEIIRAAAYAYLSSNPSWNIEAEGLHQLISDSDTSNDPFILSVRAPAAYNLGHIPGAINITLADLAKPENLAKLPTDKKIVVYCYTGHTGSQATALLNILGYDAVNLKFGMTSWTLDTEVASGRYIEANDCMNYPFETGAPTDEEGDCG